MKLQKDVLGQLFCPAAISNVSVCEVHHGPRVPIEERLEGLPVPVLSFQHQGHIRVDLLGTILRHRRYSLLPT
jgi:hypothetical protein